MPNNQKKNKYLGFSSTTVRTGIGMVGFCSIFAVSSSYIETNVSANEGRDYINCKMQSLNSTTRNRVGIFILGKNQKNIDTLNKFKKLKKNWNGYGAEPIPIGLIDYTINLLSDLHYQPTIFPTGRKSIQIEYLNQNKDYLEIEIGKDSHTYYCKKGNEISEGEIELKTIKDFINEFYS